MKFQLDDEGIVEVLSLPKGETRLAVGAHNKPSASVSMTSREVRVVVAALEAAIDESLD
jgi:hypothetical protein